MANDETWEEQWEEQAESFVTEALDSIQVDAEERLVRVDIDGQEHTFADFDDFRHMLVRELEWTIEAGAPDGIDHWSAGVEDLVDDLLFRSSVEDTFEDLKPKPDKRQLLLVFDELLPPSAEGQTRVDLLSINDELIRYLATHPDQMHHLHPRKFEELVAELFRDMGWDVHLTPTTRDGGIDFRAFRKEPFGTILTLVECKRYRPDRKVGVGVVRSLHGVLGTQHASHGVVATTSFFTRDAQAERELIRGRMSLSDFDALCAWLKKYGAR